MSIDIDCARRTAAGAAALRAAIAATLLTAGAAGAVAATPATAAGEAAGLEEVTVSARRVSERLQDVPMSVTSLSGEMLERQSAQTVFDVQATVPALRVRYGSGDQSTLIVSLRGPTHNRQDVTVDPAVGIYVDDVVYAHPVGTNADLLDIASVEVLQGPQGTLFGRNTIGGALVIKTKDPQHDVTSMVVGAGAGSYGHQKLSGVLNLPLTDRLALRVAAQTAGNSGLQRELVTNTRLLKSDVDSGRVKLDFRLNDAISVLAGFEYLDVNGRSPAMAIMKVTSATAPMSREIGLQSGGTHTIFDYEAPPAGTTYGNGPGVADFDTIAHTAYLRGTWRASWAETNLIVSRRSVRHHRLFDIDGTPFNVFNGGYDHGLEQWTGELRSNGNAFSDRLAWQAGVFFFTEKGIDDTHFLQWPTINGPTRTPQNNLAYLKTDSTAAYTQATYHFTDRFSMTGGLRYTKDDKKLTARNFLGPPDMSGPTTCNVPVAARPASGECVAHLKYDDNQTNYVVSLEYKFTPDMLAYVRHGTGFRAGGLNQRVNNIGTLDPFAGEEITDTEVGLKADWLDRRLRTNLSLFYSDYKNLLLAIQDFLRGSFVTNAGDVEQKGGQLTVDALVTDDLRLGASYARTEVEYTRINPLAGPVAPDLLAGVPENTAAFNAEYTRDLGNLGRLFLRADYQWTDKINYVGIRTAYEPYFTSRSVGLVNARIGFAFANQPIDVAVWGKNVLDKKYMAYGLDQASIGAIVGQWGPPAQFGVDVTYRFGD